ncbi:MAG: heme exporter protein CcmD [Anderseniella sp.]|jgi:heme exporter protein D|nr:heme exporter protein CcmD [Anderseniella sp.]
MIDFSADHIGFVIASYAVTFAVLGALLAWTLIRARAITRRLETLERDGTPRRRASSPAGAS